MSKSRSEVTTAEQVRSLLGNVSLPGSVEEFTAALTQRSGNVMRVRRWIAVDDLPIPSEPIDWYRLGHRPVCNSPKPSRFLAYAAGDYFVQDAGSLLALAAAGADTDALQGKLICDLCAAPGGKATALVEAIGDSTDGKGGFLLANEVIFSRVGALQLNLARTGSDRYGISSLDPETLADRLAGVFDLVLVDAPCSGQAMLGRGKQTRASLSVKQIGHSAIRQNRILDAAVRLARDGGRLIYSTCTFAEAENENQVSRLIDAGIARPDRVASLDRYQTTDGCYRLWPHRHDCAGAFAASLQISHKDSGGDPYVRRREEQKHPPHRLPEELSVWYGTDGTGSSDWSDQVRLQQADSIIYGWPVDSPRWIEGLAVAGPELAHRVGQTWKPSHAAALRRVSRATPQQTIEIDDAMAKRFIRGEAIECNGTGWQVVRLGGRPLGWIKASGRIGKNHLPKSARMLGQLNV